MRTFIFIILAIGLGGLAYITGDMVSYVLLGFIYIALLKILDVLREMLQIMRKNKK